MSKIGRISRECLFGDVGRNRFSRMIASGWQIVHNPGTAFVSLEHPAGGKQSLVEVKTNGALTCGEADPIAAIIAEDLRKRFHTDNHRISEQEKP